MAAVLNPDEKDWTLKKLLPLEPSDLGNEDPKKFNLMCLHPPVAPGIVPPESVIVNGDPGLLRLIGTITPPKA